jgi:hypothetical protein
MKRRNPIAIAVIAISVSLVAPSAVFAAPAGIHSPVHAMFSKTKNIKFTLRNDSSSPMELKVGEEVVTLDAGKSLEVKLPAGARILANSATQTHQAGSVIAEVSDSLNGAIIHVK